MRSSDRAEIEADYAALHEIVSRIVGHTYDELMTPERLTYLDKLELEARRLAVPGHQLINQLAEQSDPSELGGTLCHTLAGRLRITRTDAARRVAEAADLGPRRAITGEPLPPLLSGTAVAQRNGDIGAGHVRVLRELCTGCPAASTWAPASTPRPIWPNWPPSIGLMSCPNWPTGSPRSFTRTAISPTSTAPGDAA
jgi:uncharacterized protein DUF222